MAGAQSLESFATELLIVAAEVIPVTMGVVGKAAQNVKSEARANVLQSSPGRNAGAHYAINYDTPKPVGMRVVTEVGYDKDDKRGRLGNLLEFGGGGDHSPPHRDLGRAADSEEPRFEDAIATMARKLL